MLPRDVRSRTFTATLPSPTASPANGFSRVVVGGATFFEDWNLMKMGIAGDDVAFWLEVLVEQISPNAFLALGGQAAASIGTSDMSTITLPFAGSIDYCVTPSEKDRFQECLQDQSVTRARCDSKNHRLILTRR